MSDILTVIILVVVTASLWIFSLILTRQTNRLRDRTAQLDRETAEALEQVRLSHDLMEWQQLERLELVFKLGHAYGVAGTPLQESIERSTVAALVADGKRRLLKPVKTSTT